MANTTTALKSLKNEAMTLKEAFESQFLPMKEAGVRCVSTKTKNETGKGMTNIFCKAEEVYNLDINPLMDYYITLNSLKNWNRRASNVLTINAFYVDLDYRDKGLTKEQCIHLLYQVLDDENIFMPTMIMDSGRGLWLFWSLEPIIVHSPKIVTLWSQIQSDLIAKLAVLGSDSAVQSVTNLVRLPGSVNQKNHIKTSLVEYNENAVYEMYDFQDEISTFKPKNRPKKAIVNYMRNEYHLNYLRVVDIEKLFELRDYDIYGIRNIMLFVYRNMLNLAEDINAEDKVDDMNQKLVEPVSTSELRSLNKDNKTYLFKNTTLIERLKINEDEMVFMKTIIDLNEYKRRQRLARNARYAPTKQRNQEKKEQRNKKVKDMIKDGLTQKEVAQVLSINQSTVSRILT